jgi:hypothetical protein
METLPMRCLMSFVLVAVSALSARAGETTKSNSLTPKEAAEGWLLLFDGQTRFGWTSSQADKLSVKDGVLRVDAGKLHNTTVFNQFALEFQCKVSGARKHSDVQLRFRGKAFDAVFIEGKKEPIWARGKLIVVGDKYRFSLDSSRGNFPVATGTFTEAGPGLLEFALAEDARLELRDVALMPLEMKPLFNGKNLDGWKEFPGKKSKFSVNDKLELNLKDGPGDLQTDGKYGDFLLQIGCISNGKHLNSGVFFRCRAGEYQNGYEAQIHNHFTAEPTKEYILEEYDPNTHQLIAKKKEKFAAVDFGTGAIYRRVPARKEVARDGEWFTMTVVAHGNHFATWVNGIQVVDWSDHRPQSDNARKGFRLAPGHISLQGHDPTTDLSFRNIKISEYPAAGKQN